MVYLITIVTSVASAMLVFILQSALKENHQLKLEREQIQKKRENALEDGVLCLLRAQLIKYHEEFMKIGHITPGDYEAWDLMHKAYVALGGNGMIVHMNQDIESLEIKD